MRNVDKIEGNRKRDRWKRKRLSTRETEKGKNRERERKRDKGRESSSIHEESNKRKEDLERKMSETFWNRDRMKWFRMGKSKERKRQKQIYIEGRKEKGR